jgi:hypothetical protein
LNSGLWCVTPPAQVPMARMSAVVGASAPALGAVKPVAAVNEAGGYIGPRKGAMTRPLKGERLVTVSVYVAPPV